jgi:hypothetical protein
LKFLDGLLGNDSKHTQARVRRQAAALQAIGDDQSPSGPVVLDLADGPPSDFHSGRVNPNRDESCASLLEEAGAL